MADAAIRALLIEDNPGDARLIQAYLAEVSDGHELERVDRLTDGLARLDRGGVDVVLLDLSLPESNGLETFRLAHRHAPDTPTIVLTGLDDQELAVQAVHEGAEDYLVKGQVDGPMLMRSMRYALERWRRRQLEEKLQATEAEFRVAQEIQQGLYPEAAPAVPGLEIAGASFPAEAVGGDYYDYFPLAGGSLGVVIGDAIGHGVGPALLIAETRACLRTLAITQRGVDEMLTLANRVLVEGLQDNLFVTLAVLQIDPQARSLTFASAGHPTAYVIDAEGQVRESLESTGFPLGIFPDATFPAGKSVPLRPHDLILMITDGVTEARPGESLEMFGEERTVEVVRGLRHRTAAEIVAALYEAVSAFRDGSPAADDVTVVVIKVTPGIGAETHAHAGTASRWRGRE